MRLYNLKLHSTAKDGSPRTIWADCDVTETEIEFLSILINNEKALHYDLTDNEVNELIDKAQQHLGI